MISRQRIAAISAAGLVAAGLVVVSASPAFAETPPDSCTNYSICGYVNIQFRTDQGYELNYEKPIGTCTVVTFRNKWSGVYNYTSRPIRLFKNTGCTGTDYKTINPYTGEDQFSVELGITWDNSVDAYKTV